MAGSGRRKSRFLTGRAGKLRRCGKWLSNDLRPAYHMLVTVNPVAGSPSNIGGAFHCTVGDILDKLISLSPRAGEIEVVPDPDRFRPIDADLQIPDTTKFRTHTSWEPQIPYEQTMQDLLDY